MWTPLARVHTFLSSPIRPAYESDTYFNPLSHLHNVISENTDSQTSYWKTDRHPRIITTLKVLLGMVITKSHHNNVTCHLESYMWIVCFDLYVILKQVYMWAQVKLSTKTHEVTQNNTMVHQRLKTSACSDFLSSHYLQLIELFPLKMLSWQPKLI